MKKSAPPDKVLMLTKESLRVIAVSVLSGAQGGTAYPAVEYFLAPPSRPAGR